MRMSFSTGAPKALASASILDADSSDRRGRLLAAAYDLLDEEGLEGLTIRAVLARTGLARRAFYDCFAGKDDLVLAVFDRTLREAAAFFERLIAEEADPLRKLKVIVVSIVLGKYGLGNPPPGTRDLRGAALSREHMRLAESRPADLHSALRPLLGLIARTLANGMAGGTFRQGDADRMATLVYNLVSTTVHTELLAEESGLPDITRRAALADDLWEFCRRAVIA